MNVWINGAKADDLAESLRARVDATRGHPDAPPPRAAMHAATRLADARDESDYLRLLLELCHAHTDLVTTPPLDNARPGWRGRLGKVWRRLLWRLLRHQHEHMAAQQNAINRQWAALFGLLHDEFNRRLEENRGAPPP